MNLAELIELQSGGVKPVRQSNRRVGLADVDDLFMCPYTTDAILGHINPDEAREEAGWLVANGYEVVEGIIVAPSQLERAVGSLALESLGGGSGAITLQLCDRVVIGPHDTLGENGERELRMNGIAKWVRQPGQTNYAYNSIDK